MQEFAVRPQPDDPRLTRTVAGIDHEGRAVETAVVMERPLTLFLNRQTKLGERIFMNLAKTTKSTSALWRISRA